MDEADKQLKEQVRLDYEAYKHTGIKPSYMPEVPNMAPRLVEEE